MFLGYQVERHNATTFVGDRFAPALLFTANAAALSAWI
jgi:hypothetical protein